VKTQLALGEFESASVDSAERPFERAGLARFQPRMMQVVKEVEQADPGRFVEETERLELLRSPEGLSLENKFMTPSLQSGNGARP